MTEDDIFLSNGRVEKKRSKSMRDLNSDRMVVHIALTKFPEREGSTSPSMFYGKLPGY